MKREKMKREREREHVFSNYFCVLMRPIKMLSGAFMKMRPRIHTFFKRKRTNSGTRAGGKTVRSLEIVMLRLII